MNYTFQWGPVWAAWRELTSGVVITLELTFLCSIFGLAFGIILAIAKRSGNWFARAVAVPWIETARNTPSLLQIYIAYFGLGVFGINISAWWAVLLAITFNTAGYLAEILRGGFGGVSVKQRAAALSLGMRSYQVYFYIILPQVLRIVFLPIMNQVVFALLGTSLGMIIGLNDLAGVTATLQSRTFRPFEFYFVTACIYYTLVKAITLVTRWMGRHYLRDWG
jgi:His/Glu/Gln/Arg/opine family amino acid ABC transporter permease subunit